MRSTLTHVAEALAHLRKGEDPVSFYDALLLVRQLPNGADLPDALLQELMGLHDATHTTDGAREILAEFLSAYANRLALEHTLGDTPITLKHNGKRVRVHVGQSILLKLSERRGAGYRWELLSVEGHANHHRRAKPSSGPVAAEFTLVANKAGTVRIHLQETRPPNHRVAGVPGRPPRTPREFRLEIIAVPSPEQDHAGLPESSPKVPPTKSR